MKCQICKCDKEQEQEKECNCKNKDEVCEKCLNVKKTEEQEFDLMK